MNRVDRNFLNSTLREKIVEHLFVGELLRQLWRQGILNVEVLRSEFDSSGYDVAVSQGDIIRHIQLKTTTRDAKRRSVGVHRALAEKPSGCVLWVCVDNDLNLGPFYWFGSALGERLPSLDGCRPSKRATANAQGIKPQRSHHVKLKRSSFTRLENIAEVMGRLFDRRFVAHK